MHALSKHQTETGVEQNVIRTLFHDVNVAFSLQAISLKTLLKQLHSSGKTRVLPSRLKDKFYYIYIYIYNLILP